MVLDSRAFVVRTINTVSGVFDELKAGRARFGWSYADNLDLRKIRDKLSRGDPLDEHEQKARRCLGFLDRVSVGDYLVYPNQPERRLFAVAKVTGEYEYSQENDGLDGDFRSFRTCSLETPIPVSWYDQIVPSQLRHRIGRPGRFSEINDTRSLSTFLSDVSAAGTLQDESNQPAVSRIYKALRESLPDSLYQEFNRADLSRRFCRDLFDRMGYNAHIQEGAGEAGSDVIVKIASQLLPEDVEFRVGVQVASFTGKVGASTLTGKLNQLLNGWEKNRLDYGLLLTTGNCGEDARRALREHSDERSEKVRLIDGDELAELFLRYFPT